jgi:hypothetical protein
MACRQNAEQSSGPALLSGHFRAAVIVEMHQLLMQKVPAAMPGLS